MKRTLSYTIVFVTLLIFSGCAGRTHWVPVKSKASLYHLGSIDSFDMTEDGTQAARLLLDALQNKKPESARNAVDIYSRIIPKENFGGEYTALKWFGEYLLASEAERKKFLEDPYSESYFRFFGDNDYAVLKEYLKRKYKLETIKDDDPEAGMERRAFLEDFILFNNPRREEWERTSEIIAVIPFKKGDKIADIGSGPGYYSFQFAQRVGSDGRIYSIDTKQEHLDYMAEVIKRQGIENISLIKSSSNDIGVHDTVDFAFMCSVYHIIYGTMKEQDRTHFINSIKKALKKDGILVIVDNDLVEGPNLPYHGPYIVRELIINQLSYHGFRLVGEHQFTPQRYVLLFNVGPTQVR